MNKLSVCKLRLSAILLVALMSSVCVSTPWNTAEASERLSKAVAIAAKSYPVEQSQLSRYASLTDGPSRLALARMLTRGKMTGPKNPLRIPDIDGAVAVYRGLLSPEDRQIQQKAQVELADLLMREGGTDNENEAAALRKALEKPIVANALNQTDQPIDVQSDLRDKMSNGSLDAALDLLLLQSRENPSEVDTLRSQMVLMANVSALDGDSAVVRLVGRYAASFDAARHPETLKALLVLASAGGSDSLIGIVEKNREIILPILGKEVLREIIWRLVDGGSTRAAELMVLDLVDNNVYGFDEADAKWAATALEEAGSYRANYIDAKLYYQGIYVKRDLERAVGAMERMLDGAAGAGQDRLIVADRLARMNLSDGLIAKYALPIYLNLWKDGNTAVIGRLARIVVSAERAGFYESPADMPIAPAELVSDLSSAYTSGDLSSGMILGDIYREGRLVDENIPQARAIYQDVMQQYADQPEMALKLREQLAKIDRKELEVTPDRAPYYAEVRSLVELNNFWAMRELGLLLNHGAPQIEREPDAGFDLLLKALSMGYFPAGPDAADIAIANNNVEQLKRIATVYEKFDNRTLSPESNVLLAKVDFALRQFKQAEQLLDSPEVQDLPTGRFLLAQVRLSLKKLSVENAQQEMREVILSFRGDDGQLLGFIQQLAHQSGSSSAFMEPVLVRLAALADKRNVGAINAAFKLRQRWKDSQALSFRKVVEWSSVLAERGESGPLARVATNINIKVVGEENYHYLVDTVEAVLPHVPTNGNLRMFMAKEYLKGRFRPKDFEKSDEFVKQAAELGNEEALNSVANDYFYGQGVELDRKRAEVLYRDLSFVGSNRSSLALARSYSKGPSVGVYESRAFAYYIKAALNGSVTAMTEMGRSYLAGAGVAMDEAKGQEWLEKAASMGNTDAMTQLYYFHFIKNPTNQNQQAERWLDELVAAEVPDMVVRKAVLLHERNSEKNNTEVFALLNQAEELGSQFARRLKNAYIKNERDGVKK